LSFGYIIPLEEDGSSSEVILSSLRYIKIKRLAPTPYRKEQAKYYRDIYRELSSYICGLKLEGHQKTSEASTYPDHIYLLP